MFFLLKIRRDLCHPKRFGTFQKGAQARVSQKTRKLHAPEKPFVKPRSAYSVKLGPSHVVKGIKIEITAKFRDTEHFRFEDTEKIISPEKFRDFRETGPRPVYSYESAWCQLNHILRSK